MQLNVRTVYSSFLQDHLLLGKPFVMKEKTTLNERHDVQALVPPTSTEFPRLGYLSIGNGGHRMVVGADSIPYPMPLQHLTTDASNFKPIPWVVRLPANDLTAGERSKYALRKEVELNGRTYIAYYLRRLDLTDVIVEMEYRVQNEDGTTTVTSFVPDTSNLYPEPQELSNTMPNVTTGEYVSASAKILINITAAEVEELINVAVVMFNNEQLAIISEIGLVTAVDKTVPVTGATGSFQFVEAIAAQIASHVAVFYPLNFSKDGIEIALDVGSTEPLWKVTT